MLGFMVLAAGIFVAIVISPGLSPARRVFGAVVDSAATSYFMARTGVNGLPLYVVYLWIIVGNGFRYGKLYLLNTLALSGIGFAIVLYTSPFWQTHLGGRHRPATDDGRALGVRPVAGAPPERRAPSRRSREPREAAVRVDGVATRCARR